jgi:hypothetical protein
MYSPVSVISPPSVTTRSSLRSGLNRVLPDTIEGTYPSTDADWSEGAETGLTVGHVKPIHITGSASQSARSDTLMLRVSGDQDKGPPRFTIKVDGQQIGGTYSTLAPYAQGKWQDITLAGNFGDNPKLMTVTFINDGWNGIDRNLYIDNIRLNGRVYEAEEADNYASDGYNVPSAAALRINGSINFNLRAFDAGAVKFAPGAYVSVGNILQYEKHQPWTVSAAVVIESPPRPNGAELVFGNTNGPPYAGYELWIDGQAHLRVRIISNFGAEDYLDVGGTTNVADGALHSVSATYDGSGIAAGVKLYLDGVAETLITVRDTLHGSTVSTGPMIIGNQLNGWEDKFNLHGKMNWFTFSDIAQPEGYLAANANNASAYVASAYVDSSTVLALNFNEGTGSTTMDASGHGHNGVLSPGITWA